MIRHKKRKSVLAAKLKSALKARPDNITARCYKIGSKLGVAHTTIRNYITGACLNDGYLGEDILAEW